MDYTSTAILTHDDPELGIVLLSITDAEYQFFHWLKNRGYVNGVDLKWATIITPNDGAI